MTSKGDKSQQGSQSGVLDCLKDGFLPFLNNGGNNNENDQQNSKTPKANNEQKSTSNSAVKGKNKEKNVSSDKQKSETKDQSSNKQSNTKNDKQQSNTSNLPKFSEIMGSIGNVLDSAFSGRAKAQEKGNENSKQEKDKDLQKNENQKKDENSKNQNSSQALDKSNSLPLNLGRPLEEISLMIHETIKSKSSRKPEQTKNNEENSQAVQRDKESSEEKDTVEQPKQENPKQENPKQENSKQENPKQDNSKQENPKQENPKQENPKQEKSQGLLGAIFNFADKMDNSISQSLSKQAEEKSSRDLKSNENQAQTQTETQTQPQDKSKSEEKEEKKQDEKEQDEKEQDEKGQEESKGELEQYISDNILITMVGSPQHKSTAGTQTDPNCNLEEEEEEETNDQNDEDDEDDGVPPIQVPKFSDEELREALQKQLTTQQLPPQEMREAIIDYARRQSLFKLMEEDYDTASKIDDAIAANMQSLKDDHRNIEADMLNNHLKHRLVEAESSKSSLQDEWRKKIRSFKENEENELQKIAERHEQERRLFESHWTNSATLMPFSKPSSSLLQLRSMQKAFALSHDFANARQLKISAERKQKEESIEASKKASKSMRKEYLNLVKKQQQELSCFNDLSNRKLGKLEAQRDTELKINENVRFQLASRVNKSRLIKKPMVMMATRPKIDVRSASLSPVTGIMTYRTRSQFANYRQSVEMKMLDVKINDLHSIMKPLTPAVPMNQKNQKNQKSTKKREKSV